MSRIGKKAVPVPKGVTATVDGQKVIVKGPKGELSFTAIGRHRGQDGRWRASRSTPRDRVQAGALGLGHVAHAWSSNLIEGVTKGFERKLEINGVGYRAAVQGKNLQLQLGYSHEILYPIPAGIAIVTPKPTEIVISGIDKQKVGQVAAEIREYRGPEPYKGKGVKYADE